MNLLHLLFKQDALSEKDFKLGSELIYEFILASGDQPTGQFDK